MLNERLKELRNEKNVNQEFMANMLKITRQAYGNWETGKNIPDINSLIKIAEFYCVSTDWLLTGKTSDAAKMTGDIKDSSVVLGDNSGLVLVSKVGDKRLLSPEEEELFRIFQLLEVRSRMKLLQTAYELEENNKTQSVI